MTSNVILLPESLWEKHAMAVEDVNERMRRITDALETAGVPFALVGGQAVAAWVATRDPKAVRTTKDVDILLSRVDLPRARAAARTIDMEYFEVLGVGMFVDRQRPNPKDAVHLVWAGEKVRADNLLPSPIMGESQVLGSGKPVVSLAALVLMKLMANRDLDRVHLRDMIEVGLVDRDLLAGLPTELAARLESLLVELGR
jgi:hypothetical protein